MENENDAILAQVPSAPRGFLAIHEVLQQTTPHQLRKILFTLRRSCSIMRYFLNSAFGQLRNSPFSISFSINVLPMLAFSRSKVAGYTPPCLRGTVDARAFSNRRYPQGGHAAGRDDLTRRPRRASAANGKSSDLRRRRRLSMSVKMMWRTPMDSMRSANAMWRSRAVAQPAVVDGLALSVDADNDLVVMLQPRLQFRVADSRRADDHARNAQCKHGLHILHGANAAAKLHGRAGLADDLLHHAVVRRRAVLAASGQPCVQRSAPASRNRRSSRPGFLLLYVRAP